VDTLRQQPSQGLTHAATADEVEGRAHHGGIVANFHGMNNKTSEAQRPAYRWDGDVLVIQVLGKPGARRDAIGEVHGNELKISVTASPTSGRATDHMLRFLAKEFGVAVSAIDVVFGQTSVHKQLRIRDPQKWPQGLPPLSKS